MFNSRFINIGALALMVYCIYEFRSTNYSKNVSPEIQMTSNAKYTINWNMDESSNKQTTADKVLNYIFADKVKAIKDLSNHEDNNVVLNDDAAAIGDIVDGEYKVVQEDGSSETFSLKRFVLEKSDPLTQFIVNMEVGRDKDVLLQKKILPENVIEVRGQHAILKISIKSLTKAHN